MSAARLDACLHDSQPRLCGPAPFPKYDLLSPSEAFGVVALPLLAAILFAFATLCLKGSTRYGIDTWRINFVSNLITAIAFQPFWLACTSLPPISQWWQPAVVAGLYIVGQVLTLLSITKGEVSIAAPVLGLKLIFVPLFIAAIGAGSLPSAIWPACLLACLGVALLNYSKNPNAERKLLYSVGAAAAGAGAFAMFDVCVQLWSPLWTGGGFLPLMFIGSTVLSLTFIPGFAEPLRTIRGRSRWLLLGVGFFFAVQALAIVASVAFWQQAAQANVVYSTRGMWSLLLVAGLGARLGLADTSLDPRTLAVRILGAAILLAAIVVLLV